MPLSLSHGLINHALFDTQPTPLQRARRAAAAPAARAAHVARKNLEPCGAPDDACCGAASAAPGAVYVALRVHDTKITLLRLRAPPPRPPVAASPITTPATATSHRRNNTPRPLPPARARALRQRLLRLADARRRDDDARCLAAAAFFDVDIMLPEPPLAIAHADVVADADALLRRLAAA